MELQNRGGRPSKKTREVEAKILSGISEGLPLHAAAALGGVHYDTLLQWRKEDPDFEQQVKVANSRAIETTMEMIRAAVPTDWRAGAWILERRFPEDFSRPEVQLNTQINTFNQLNQVDVAQLLRDNLEPLQALLHGKTLPAPDP
jgi:hypothetical protein